MTAVASPTAHTLAAGRRTSPLAVALALAGRSLRLIPRSPATFVPSLVFPVITVVAFGGAFDALVRLPGFPVDRMINWILPMSVVQGAAFAGVTSGMGVARDIEGRFFDRLLLVPMSHRSLVAGPLLAATIRGAIPFTVVLTAGLISGADLRGGLLGALMLLIASCGAALAAAGWALGLAFRIPGQRAAPLMQVGIFVLTFLSTAQVPLFLMTGWLKAAARINPVTQVLALGRQGFIGPVTWHQTWPGILAVAGMSLATTVFAVRGIRRLVP